MKFVKNPFTYSIILLWVACSTGGCEMAILSPRGQIGLEERSLILIAIGLMLIVVLPAIFMAVFFFWKYRESKQSDYAPEWSHSTKIECVVWAVPILIIVVLATITWKTTHTLDPYRPIEHDTPPINIQVISLDWKWLFIYPDYNIAVVNELAFPIDTPIAFKVTSDTVMNSFFIPRLGGQIYTMAGMQTQLHLIANKAGRYKGISSGYSGHGFSDMKFTAIATKTRAEFEQWIAKVRQSKDTLLSDAQFNALSKPTYGYPITYYSDVKPGLFHELIDTFMTMNNHETVHKSLKNKGAH